MQTFDLGYKDNDGKDYYEVVIDLLNKSFFMVKNSSCQANTEKFISEKFGIEHYLIHTNYRIIFNLNSPAPDMNRVPKKYHSIINQETDLEKLCKKRFYGLSNEDLVNKINRAPDFGWDDEGVELQRRIRLSNGNFQCKMNYNTLVIVKDANNYPVS